MNRFAISRHLTILVASMGLDASRPGSVLWTALRVTDRPLSRRRSGHLRLTPRSGWIAST